MAVQNAALKRDIRSLIFSYQNSIMLSHTIFELSPRDDDRLFGDALIGTVSSWALDLLLGAYESQKSDAAAEFYDSIADIPKARSLRGCIFERQLEVLRTAPPSNGCIPAPLSVTQSNL